MSSAFHDGLGALQFHVGVEAFDQGEIAVAGKQGAQLGDAEGAVQLGVAAASYVEVKGVFAAFELLNFQRAVALPGGQGIGESGQAIVALLAGHGGALLVGDGDDGLAQDFADALGVEFAFEVLQEGLQDARFGLAAIEDTEALVEGVGWGWV